MTPSLAERLRSETRVLHIAAERSRLMRVLMRGEMSRSVYCAMLRNLHAIYAVLEPALALHAADPHLAPITMPGLARAGAIEEDLQTLHGPGWPDLEVVQSAAAYVQRLQEIGRLRPGLLLAHAYVRYLGDLSGGQMLRRVVARSMNVSGGSGTAFYDFGDATQTKALTRAFRQGLGSIVLEPAADAIVHEAAWSFRAHRVLFFELANDAGLTNGRPRRAAIGVTPVPKWATQ